MTGGNPSKPRVTVRNVRESAHWARWYDLPGLRRLALASWALRHKTRLHPTRRLARARHLYWVLVRGWDSEICGRCGGPVRVVFHAPDAIWETVTGLARSPGGEAAGGILCVPCVDDLYGTSAGGFLRWTCAADDSVMVG